MNKVHREGVDVGIAFSSGARHLQAGLSQPTNSNAVKQKVVSLFSRVIPALGEAALFVFHLPKIFVQHIISRFRRISAEDIRLIVQQEIRQGSTVVLEEMKAVNEKLRQDLIDANAFTVSEKIWQDQTDANALATNLFPRLDRIEKICSDTARRFAINCGQGEILVRTSVGYILCAATDHAVLACLADTGELELGTRLLIERFLKPGDVFVDVGANLGMHTLAAARAMQGRGRIIAFEPYKPTKLLLEKSVWMNGFSEITEIHQAAVSNTIGHQKLFLGAASGHHSLYPLEIAGEFSLEPVNVPLVRLDGVFHAGQKVDLIKIDTEGAELDVLESATELIKGSPDVALIVEFGPSHLKRTSHTTQEWFEAFTRLGLNYQVINSETGVLEDWPLEKMESTFSVNLFFARKDSYAWGRTTT